MPKSYRNENKKGSEHSGEEATALHRLKDVGLKTISLKNLILAATATFALGAAFYAGRYSKLQSSSEGITLEGQDTTKDNSFTSSTFPIQCRTAIFYETHLDSAPVKFIDTILDRLKEHSYKTFLFEEPKGISCMENLERLSAGIEKLKQVSHIPESLKDTFIESFEWTINLLNRINELGLHYVAVDIDADSRKKLDSMDPHLDSHNIKYRDKFMAESIDKACKKYQEKQVLIVGSIHGGIVLILKELGHDVTSAFIINHQELYDPELETIGRADNDMMLRTGNTEYMKKYGYENMHTVNFYDDSDVTTSVAMTGLFEELGIS